MGKKVLLIDPWGTRNTKEYLNGLIYGLDPLTELTVFTNCYFELKITTNSNIHRVFFKKTEKMRKTIYRRILRGLEYVVGYLKVFGFLRKENRYDVIHINWLLNYAFDIRVLKRLKKYTSKIVYTAHNVIPHNNGEKSIEKLRIIYSYCDVIILHGESVRDEFALYFPEFVAKTFVQKHGANLNPDVYFDECIVDNEIKTKLKAFNEVFIFFGSIYYSKGTDRLVRIWSSRYQNCLLVIAGQRNGDYFEFDQCLDKINNSKNILYLDGYIDNNTLNYIIANSDMVLLPYRHASMSGVVFTAADFCKPILCTNAGAIKEYIINEIDGFIVENDDEEISKKINQIINDKTKAQLSEMGRNLNKNIAKSCSWNYVMEKVVRECY